MFNRIASPHVRVPRARHHLQHDIDELRDDLIDRFDTELTFPLW